MMRATGTGRIVLWGGGSVWIGRAGEATDFHAHHAVQITLAFPGNEVRFRRPSGRWRSYAGTIVAAHQMHAFEARETPVALVFVEPESREGRAIHLANLDEGIAPLKADLCSTQIESLARAYAQNASNEDLAAQARSIIARLAAISPAPRVPLDERIGRAVEFMRGRLDEPILLAHAANAANLSADRFRHLFVEEIGMRFRPYVLWLRIERALARYVAGETLTEASHAAGFADSAHLSRTFKRMFGVAPASFRFDDN